MSRHSLLGLIFFLFGSIAYAQCPVGNLVFETQGEVDSFAVNFPNCSVLDGDILVNGADQVVSLLAFSGLTEIIGDLSIVNCSNLTNLNGLHNITRIERAITIRNNALITSLEGFSSLSFAGFGMVVQDNPHLVNFEGVDNLVTVNTSLQVENNAVLENFIGLENLETIGLVFIVRNNHSIASMAGLDSLSLIGEMVVTFNDGLTEVGPMPQLDSIIWGVNINNNPILSSLSGFDRPISIGSLLFVDNNPQLSWCGVEAICDYVTERPDEAFIDANSAGCNSTTEVMNSCLVSIEELNSSGINIYPNPGSNHFHIDLPGNLNDALISVYSSCGKEVHTHQEINQSIDTSHWTPGVYFIKITHEGTNYSSKLIIN
ncbi:MAG: T9SS type A sorting domain-containing protein [Bacteroidota bacterium]